MAKKLVSDELWETVAPLLPAPPAHPRGGHPYPVSDRAALTGIIFVLKTGLPWEHLPREMGCGSGMSCWRRLRAWQRAGVWKRLHHLLLQRLADAGKIDWSRASADAARVPAKGGRRDRPEPDRPGQAGRAPPPGRRPPRRPAGRLLDRCRRERRAPARTHGRRHHLAPLSRCAAIA